MDVQDYLKILKSALEDHRRHYGGRDPRRTGRFVALHVDLPSFDPAVRLDLVGGHGQRGISGKPVITATCDVVHQAY